MSRIPEFIIPDYNTRTYEERFVVRDIEEPDMEELRNQIEQFQNGLGRYFSIQGMAVRQLDAGNWEMRVVWAVAGMIVPILIEGLP